MDRQPSTEEGGAEERRVGGVAEEGGSCWEENVIVVDVAEFRVVDQ